MPHESTDFAWCVGRSRRTLWPHALRVAGPALSSIGGRRATPGLGAGQPANRAVGGFSEVLAREVAPLRIRVTCVEPGGMRTDMFGEHPAEIEPP